MASVGTRLRQRRQKLGLPQRDVEGPGVSYAYISRIEDGSRTPSLKALVTLAERLEVTALWLLTGKHDGHCPVCRRGPRSAGTRADRQCSCPRVRV